MCTALGSGLGAQGCWWGAGLTGGPCVGHRQMPLPPPLSHLLPAQVAGHPSGVRWEPGGLLLCASGSDFKGHFGGRHRGSFCLLRPQRESMKAFSYSGTGLFLGALGWLQDAALPPALIHGEGISWGVPSPGELQWSQGSTHPSVRGVLAAVGRRGSCCGPEMLQQSFLKAGERGLRLGSGELGARPGMLELSPG